MKTTPPAGTPTPEQISAARHRSGLTQAEAAELVKASYRTWQDWEAGKTSMHPGLWLLFKLRTGMAQLK